MAKNTWGGKRAGAGPKPYLNKSKEELIEIIRKLKRDKEEWVQYHRNERRQLEERLTRLGVRLKELEGETYRLSGLALDTAYQSWRGTQTECSPADRRPIVSRTGNVIHLHQPNNKR